MRRGYAAIACLLAAIAVGAALGMLGGDAESHPGHAQKKLFDDEVWRYQHNGDYDTWMNLSTSDVWLECDVSAAACGDKWFDPFDLAMADWNSQPMTVRFDYTEDVYDLNRDINVFVADDVLGDFGLLGLALPFDGNDDVCFGACEVHYGVVLVGDGAHIGPYGTPLDRQATIAHEIGHLLHLRHESTNADESILYDCGMDDTGPIPHSIMAYSCVDPVSMGGAGEYWVQPWDVCGVNHVYEDPAYGFAGCDGTTSTPTPSASPSPTPGGTETATPTPSPTPIGQTPSPSPSPTPEGQTPSPTPTPAGVSRVWGDVNCSGGADPVDSLGVLRHDAGLNVNSPVGCPGPGEVVVVNGALNVAWGNVDCGPAVDPVDALKLLRNDAGLSVNQPGGCPDIGSAVNVVS